MQLSLMDQHWRDCCERVVDAGRHMLTEMVVDNYIPNDTHMNEDDSCIQVRACHTEVSHDCFPPSHGTFCIWCSMCTLTLPQQCLGGMATADRVTQ